MASGEEELPYVTPYETFNVDIERYLSSCCSWKKKTNKLIKHKTTSLSNAAAD